MATYELPAPPPSRSMWQVGPWKRSRRWAIVAQGALIARIAVLAAMLGTCYAVFGLIDRAAAGTVRDDDVARLLGQLTQVNTLATIANVAAAFGLAAWLARSTENAAALGRGTGRWAPRILLLLIGGAACFPFLGLADGTYDASVALAQLVFIAMAIHDLRCRTRIDSHPTSRWPVLAWALLLLTANVLGFAGLLWSIVAGDESMLADLARAYVLVCAGIIGFIAADVTLLWLVRSTERRMMALPGVPGGGATYPP